MTRPAMVGMPPMQRAVRPRRSRGRTMQPECLDDPHFLAAVREMEALGLRVTTAPHTDSTAFDVLAGRAHLRWFMVPSRPRAVSIASLALIQPLRPGARLFKRFMTGAIGLGLPHLWRHGRVHVSGTNRAARVFGTDATQAAFLTGTAGPHRKLAVQLMDARGGILGYAKVSRTPTVQALLANEAAILAELHERGGLQSTVLPHVLLHEFRDGAAVLVTDTVRTPRQPCCTRLHTAHLAFLDELTARTASSRVPDGDGVLRSLRAKVAALPASLSTEWRQRFARALHALASAPDLVAPRGLAHGDFSPINTFPYRDRLCVFDWEYAGHAYPADFDLIHFMFATLSLRRVQAVDCCRAVESILIRDFGRPPITARARLAAYLCAHALRLAGRRTDRDGKPLTWEGEKAASLMLDTVLDGQGRIS